MLSILLSLLILVALYIAINDSKIRLTPKEATKHSPTRWTDEDLARFMDSDPPQVDLVAGGYLGERTGRRYIIVGGAGFLGGWIVLHLLQRGESPRNIRVIDIRFPARPDLASILSAPGPNKPAFIETDISNPESVKRAFDAPWPNEEGELTVFHTAANIRFYERHKSLLKYSTKVNLEGTKSVVEAARKAGASILVYTSSGSVGIRSTRFLLWPWERTVKYFTQVVNDEPSKLSPTKHEDYFSNYAVSKHEADKYVCAAHRSEGKQGRTLLTGCLRPGNGVFGPGGDTLLDQYARMKNGPTWIEHILSSFIYVENCSIAHLAFERTLLNSPQSPAGGQSYCICDHGDPPTYGEAYRALSIFSVPDTVKFHSLSPTLMLLISYIVQALYLARQFIPYPFKYIFPSFEAGNIKFLQPAMFDLTLVHLIFDDSRARKELGYRSAWDTRGGIWETARGRVEKKKGFVVVGGPMDGIGTPTEKENAIAREGGSGGGVGAARPQLAAEEVLGKAVRQVLESQGKS